MQKSSQNPSPKPTEPYFEIKTLVSGDTEIELKPPIRVPVDTN